MLVDLIFNEQVKLYFEYELFFFLYYYSCLNKYHSIINVWRQNFTYLEQRLIGCLLGDGWLERKSSTANTRFRFEQSYINEGRFFFIYIISLFFIV